MPSYQITTSNGQKYKVTAETDEAAMAAVNDLLGSSSSPRQEKVGFGERGQREQDMPSTPDLEREVDIAKRMAANRQGVGADDSFLQNYTFGLRDEVGALGTAVADKLFGGKDFGESYANAKEADRRLREEYAQQNPKTDMLAGIAGAVTGGLPAKPSSATGLWATAKEGAKQGAIQGSIYGAAEGDESEDGRLLGALKGGAIGTVFGGAAPVALEGAKVAASPIVNTVRSALRPEQEAARRVAAARAKDLAKGSGLDDAAYDAAVASGQPVTLMERGGENVRALSRSAANQSADARSAIDDVVRPRFATQVERLDDVLKGESKLGGNPDAFMEAADIAAKKANRPLYQKAYNLGDRDVWDPKLERLLQSPAVERAMKSAISKFKDNAILEGFGGLNSRISLDEAGNMVFRNQGGLEVRPDLRLWDLTKRELDSMAKQAGRAGNADERVYSGLAKELRDHLDTLGDMGEAYKAARATAAEFFGAQNAYEAGQKFASSKGMDAREAIRGLSKLKPEERKLFSEGYVQAQRDRLAELKNNRDATLSLMNSKGDIERARVALGKDGAQRLQAQLEVEATMDAVRKAMGNSTTARQLTELGLASAAGSGIAAGSGNTDAGSLTAGALAGAATKWGRGRLNERLSAQIGKLLTSNDPKRIEALTKMSAKSPQYLEAMRGLRRALVGAGTVATIGATAP